MKHLLIGIFIFWGGICEAQSLLFSQVIVVTDTTTRTVPAGKVWEIKSVSGGPTTNAGGFGGVFYVIINGKGIAVIGYIGYLNGAWPGYQFNVLPIWVPAGTSFCSPGAFASIIEYTIGP